MAYAIVILIFVYSWIIGYESARTMNRIRDKINE